MGAIGSQIVQRCPYFGRHNCCPFSLVSTIVSACLIVLPLSCCCERVFYLIRQPASTLPPPLDVPVTPHPTDVLLFATVENGVAVVTMPDADVPACVPMPHGDCFVVGLGPCRDWCGCCDYVLHCVALLPLCCTPPL